LWRERSLNRSRRRLQRSSRWGAAASAMDQSKLMLPSLGPGCGQDADVGSADNGLPDGRGRAGAMG
jgi:hypothetical protein